jgi:hypothetical protein
MAPRASLRRSRKLSNVGQSLDGAEWAPTGELSTLRGRMPWFLRSASRGTHDSRREYSGD